MTDSTQSAQDRPEWVTYPTWYTAFWNDHAWLLRDYDVYQAVKPIIEGAADATDAGVALAGWLAMTPGPLPERAERLREYEGMRQTGELSPRAAERLRQAIQADADAYSYHSIVQRPFVWQDGRRFTADEYNALAEREALALEGDAPAVVLWMHNTVGCYGVDSDGREWSTWSGPAQTCDVCGAQIRGGYHSGEWPGVGLTERHVCAEHVRTFGPSRAPIGAADALAQRDAYLAEQAALPNHLRDLPEHT